MAKRPTIKPALALLPVVLLESHPLSRRFFQPPSDQPMYQAMRANTAPLIHYLDLTHLITMLGSIPSQTKKAIARLRLGYNTSMGLPYTILIVAGFFFVAAAGFVFAWEAGRRRLAWGIATTFVAVVAWSVYEIVMLFIPSP